MADPMTGPAPRCQWCSAALPAPDLDVCPSCGATLTSPTATDDIKGVTTLDTEAILRARADVARPRSRILSFITGEVPVETPGEAEAASLAPPDDAVRLEMLRLQIEAERADLEAESVSLKTEAVLEQGIDLTALGETEPAGDDAGTEEAATTTPGRPEAQDADAATAPPAPPGPPTA
jgi:hypothetical protein